MKVGLVTLGIIRTTTSPSLPRYAKTPHSEIVMCCSSTSAIPCTVIGPFLAALLALSTNVLLYKILISPAVTNETTFAIWDLRFFLLSGVLLS